MQQVEVPGARLWHGRWNALTQKSEGEGDISRSYSGDVISMEGKVRTPFNHNGEKWVSVGSSWTPDGFYNGMEVKWSGIVFILAGPPLQFFTTEVEPEEPSTEPQGSLFGGGE